MDVSSLIRSTVVKLPDNPLGKQPNLTLTFERRSTDVVGEDAVGNPIFAPATTIVLKAIVREDDIQQREVDQPGLNTRITFLKGRCFSPKVIPAALRTDDKASAVFKDPANGQLLQGEFTLRFANPHWQAEIAQKLGSKISGTLLVTGGG